MNIRLLLSLLVLLCMACSNKDKNLDKNNLSSMDSLTSQTELYLLVGTYTGGDSKGIYVYRFDTITGKSIYVSEIAIQNPSYLTVSKDEKYVYSVTENGDATAAVNAFSFDKKNGQLSFINSQLTGGADPCYIEIDNTGKNVFVANYTGGSISYYATNENGALNPASGVISFKGKGLDPVRQASSHLHCVRFSPDGQNIIATDLGADALYRFGTKSEIDLFVDGDFEEIALKPGSGPRHIDFHPNGKYVYILTELSGEVLTYKYDGGKLSEIQKIQADTLQAKGSADIHVSPDGNFLYASNRLKGDGIAIFSINQTTGMLTKVGYQETGLHPRNFIITQNGRFLLVANRDSDTIQVFQIDNKTGLLNDIHADIKIDMPVCLKFISISNP